mmetsp:Transcript_32883/g.75713  ORF Transcript_32883/g.75713 Transcript_32883/m.75713 type:complete len:194 (+) Transcript_32883:244-825(+)
MATLLRFVSVACPLFLWSMGVLFEVSVDLEIDAFWFSLPPPPPRNLPSAPRFRLEDLVEGGTGVDLLENLMASAIVVSLENLGSLSPMFPDFLALNNGVSVLGWTACFVIAESGISGRKMGEGGTGAGAGTVRGACGGGADCHIGAIKGDTPTGRGGGMGEERDLSLVNCASLWRSSSLFWRSCSAMKDEVFG